MLAAHDITVERAGRRIVDGISLAVEPGRVVAVVGPNGAGKSTLLKTLTGELNPTSGHVTLDGQPLERLSASALAARRAVVPQAAHLGFPFTAIEVVMLGVTVPGFGIDESEALLAAREALAKVGLLELRSRHYGVLSGGEQQRVQIARALCQVAIAARATDKPLALLLDEPTSSLDLAHQGFIVGELRNEAAAGRAVLVVLHDLNLAAAVADEVVVLSKGLIAAQGAPARVYEAGTLSAIYGCDVTALATPERPAPIILPAIFAPADRPPSV